MRTPFPTRPLTAVLLLAICAALTATAPAHATPPLRTWSAASNGAWSSPGNWSPLGAPLAGDSVVVPLAYGAHTVTLDLDTPGLNSFVQLSPTATLDLAGHAVSGSATSTSAGILLASGAFPSFYGPLHTLAGSQLQVPSGSALNVTQAWQNDGHAVIHSTVGASASELRVNAYQTLSGAGDLQLADPVNALITSPSGYSLTHSAGHLIHGAGRITLAFTNHGTVTADGGASNTLSIENATTSNDGTFRSTGGAKLLLSNNVVNTGGLLLADGGNIELNGGVVINGSFHTTGASAIETSTNSAIGGAINLAGSLNVNSGTALSVAGGTLSDSGVVLVHPSGLAASAFRVTNYLTLTGPGQLVLNDPSLAAIDSPSGYILTHDAGHTIHGTGNITMALVNHGLVNADRAALPLTVANLVTNDGTMQATGSGILALQGSTITNSGSVSANGGEVRLTGETINGGQVQASGGSQVTAFAGTDILNGVTTSGTLQVASGAVLVTNGTISNSGVVQVRPPSGASTANLRLQNYATFQGGGAIQLTHATQSVFDSPSGYTVTQNAGHTLHGTGMVTLPLTNHGLVSADVSGQPLTLTGVTINDATFQATGGGTLVLSNNTLNNTGGSLKASGGNIQFTGEAVSGGTLSRTGTSVFQVTGNSTLNTLANSAVVQVNGGVTLIANGAFTNTGNFLVRQPAGVGIATLRLTNYSTFSGAGAIQLTDAAQSIIDSPSSYTLTNAADHTVHGTGAATLPVTNHGLVSADVSGQPLTLSGTIVNDGIMQAVGGGNLQFTGSNLNNTAGTLAATAGNVLASGVSFYGGNLTSGPGNAFVFNGSSTVAGDFTNNALLRINGGVAVLFGASTVTDSGTVQLRAPGDTAAAVLQLNNYVHFAGTGALALTHGSQSVVNSPSAYTLYNLAPHTIRGTGLVTCPFSNAGLIVADVQDSLLQVTHGTLNLTGMQAAANGGTLVFSTNTPNYGINTLVGGTWWARANSSIRFPAVDIRHLGATVVLDGAGSDLVSADSSVSALRRFVGVDLGGGFIVRNGRTFPSPGNLNTLGLVGVGPGAMLSVAGGLPGSFNMDTSATFLVELSAHGAVGCGKLTVNGLAAIHGHLRMRMLNGFQPVLTDTFEVMNFGSRSGDFATLDSMVVAPHVQAVPVWQANRLLIVMKTTYGTTDVPPTPVVTPTLPTALAFAVHGGTNAPAHLELALPHPSVVDLAVFDVTGRCVSTLAHDALSAGRWSWTWNASSEHASGMYFARARVTTSGVTRDLTSRIVTLH
jgi:hypothetical protein